MRRRLANTLRALALRLNSWAERLSPSPATPAALGYEIGLQFRDAIEQVHQFSRGFSEAIHGEERQ